MISEKTDTFDELVKSLDATERRDMLSRLAEITEVETSVSFPVSESETFFDGKSSLSEKKVQLSAEPLLVRLWFKILAFFSSSTADEKYHDYLVMDLGRKLERKFGTYISVQRRMYTDAMYHDLSFLNSARNFFIPLIAEYEKQMGDFYILLSSLIAPESYKNISASLDPFTESCEKEVPKDFRSSFLKKMEKALSDFSADEKSGMYQAAQAARWISSFCSLPLDRLVLQFSDMTGKGQMCLLDVVTDDLKKLASVLFSAMRVPVLLVEALYIFSEQDKIQDESFDFDQECAKFVKMAANYLVGITSFKSRIPVADFVRFSCGDILWEPDVERHGEDWFNLFKIAWKKRLEKRLAEWMKLHDKFILKKRAFAFLDCPEEPVMEFTPWDAVWFPMKFRREPVFLFLKSFFSSVYQKHISKILKIILVEGDFYKRENLVEFTDSFNVLEHQKQDIADFEQRLSPKGDLGEGFALALSEKIGTHAGKNRLEHLMANIESETEMLCSKVLSAFQSMDTILGGILDVSRGGPYETLINMAAIQGKQNETFRKDLAAVRFKIQEGIEILSLLEKSINE